MMVGCRSVLDTYAHFSVTVPVFVYIKKPGLASRLNFFYF